MRFLPLLLLLVLAPSAISGQPTTTPPMGQVSGRVSCGDTGQPARFAGVQLISARPDRTRDLSSRGKGSSFTTVTAMDGSYSLDKVPPGTYYVVGQFAGYLSPLNQISMADRMKPDDTTLRIIANGSEKIVVQPNQPVHVDLRLERGASISGVIRYDDGSAAPSITAVLMQLQKDGRWKTTGAATPSSSDDRGRYRITGLFGGKYAIRASLGTNIVMVGLGANSASTHQNTGDALVVYSGGALREGDVKPIEVGPGADVDGIDLVFPVHNLRSVSGFVVAKADNHPVSAGNVTLEDPNTNATLRFAQIEQDGSFNFNYVPDGMYTIRVSGAGDAERSENADLQQSRIVKSYGPVELPLNVKGDQMSLSLQVPEQGARSYAPGGAGNSTAP